MHPFVGRKPELAVLTSRLSQAVSGDPQVLLIQGPSGIGKTTLLDEFVAGIAANVVVIRASGEETEQLLTYGVVDQICRAAVEHSGRGHAEADPIADAVRSLGAELGRRREDQIGDPVHVGTLLLDLLDALDGNGLILVIDDAHWADRPSLQALTFALRRLVADRCSRCWPCATPTCSICRTACTGCSAGPNSTVLRLTGMGETELSSLAASLGISGVGSVAVRRLRDGTRETRCMPGRCSRSTPSRPGRKVATRCRRHGRSAGWCRTAWPPAPCDTRDWSMPRRFSDRTAPSPRPRRSPEWPNRSAPWTRRPVETCSGQ